MFAPQRLTAAAQASGAWCGHFSQLSYTNGVARCKSPNVVRARGFIGRHWKLANPAESEAKRRAEEEARRKQAVAEALRLADESRREAEAKRREHEEKERLSQERDAERTAAKRKGETRHDGHLNELGGFRYKFEKNRSVSAINPLGQQVHFPNRDEFWKGRARS